LVPGLNAPYAVNVKITGDMGVGVNLTGQNDDGFSLKRLEVGGKLTSNIYLASASDMIKADSWPEGSLESIWANAILVGSGGRGGRGRGTDEPEGDTGHLGADLTFTGRNEEGFSLWRLLVAEKINPSQIICNGSVNYVKTGNWGAGSTLAVAVDPGTGGLFDGDETALGGILNRVIMDECETENSENPFGIATDDANVIRLHGDNIDEEDLPFVEGDMRIVLV
jgi:hypothetical protein